MAAIPFFCKEIRESIPCYESANPDVSTYRDLVDAWRDVVRPVARCPLPVARCPLPVARCCQQARVSVRCRTIDSWVKNAMTGTAWWTPGSR
jgi:hypothetical protein